MSLADKTSLSNWLLSDKYSSLAQVRKTLSNATETILEVSSALKLKANTL
jgi:hypothetical protein